MAISYSLGSAVVYSILVFHVLPAYSYNYKYYAGEAREKYGLLGDYLGLPPVPGAEVRPAPLPAVPILVTTNTAPEASPIQAQDCKCTVSNLCVNPSTDGASVFDPRIVNQPVPVSCPNGYSYCCTNTAPTPVPICGSSSTIPVPGYTPVNGQANFGDNPWVAIIYSANGTYLGGATLIDHFNVITAAHKVFNRIPSPAKVRFGEWNVNSDTEPYKHMEIPIEGITIHESFNSGNLQNDIAIIRLASAMDLTGYPHIKSACLPAQNEGSAYNGHRCRVAGYGTNAFGPENTLQTIMKEVDVPIVNSGTCEQRLRGTRLGSGFILNQHSFLCAGGERGKDACTGDGGSPVVCKSASGQWTAVGLVAWGVGCADENIPGVYVNVANYRNWIELNKKK